MTDNQKQQFNRMLSALKRITKYDSPERLREESMNDYGLDYEEALEMSYDNIQYDAKAAINGVKRVS